VINYPKYMLPKVYRQAGDGGDDGQSKIRW